LILPGGMPVGRVVDPDLWQFEGAWLADAESDNDEPRGVRVRLGHGVGQWMRKLFRVLAGEIPGLADYTVAYLSVVVCRDVGDMQ
jgi:hypothetical protein